jgi:uncharacterized protein
VPHRNGIVFALAKPCSNRNGRGNDAITQTGRIYLRTPPRIRVLYWSGNTAKITWGNNTYRIDDAGWAMEFEWDEDKRLSNLQKHEIDFQDAVEIFDGRPRITVDSFYPDELRHLTTAELSGRFITVVWTPRGGAVRVISARRAWKKEIALLRTAQEP